MSRMKRALSLEDIGRTKRVFLDFQGEWLDFIGLPEQRGTWFIYAESGNGKTSFITQLVKYLTTFGKVLYNGLEEGNSATFNNALNRVNMKDSIKGRFLLVQDQYAELKSRLNNMRGIRFVVIDSLQYMKMNFKQYLTLKEEYTDVIFIILSHAKGKYPKGALAEDIHFDADVKIRIEGFKAFSITRYERISEYIVYEKGATEYWAKFE